MDYKDVLAYYLNKSNITPAELARRVNSPRSTIHALLTGRAKEPSLAKAKEIANVFGVSLEEMAEMVFADDGNQGDFMKMSFSEATRILFARSGMSQLDFARKGKFSTSYVSMLLRGDIKDPKFTRACEIAKALGCTPNDFAELMKN